MPDLDSRARHAVLAALRADPALRGYVLKGGLVLQHVYGSPRASLDVDLNHAEPHENAITDANTAALGDACGRLGAALADAAGGLGLASARLEVEKWSRLLPTVFARAHVEAEGGRAGSVEVQLTLSERVCYSALGRIDGVPVRVATLDDVVADKLKVLLQQRRRHQVRHSDVFDLWFALARAPFVPDPGAVRDALLTKFEAWPAYLPLRAGAFGQPGVRTFAEQGYRALRAEQPDLPFAPFDVVWDEVGRFVGAMDLPDGAE